MSKLKYPAILEVSQTKYFEEDPYVKCRRKQVCIGKLKGRFVCVRSKEEHLDWMLKQVRESINSGAISGVTLEYWNYARTVKK